MSKVTAMLIAMCVVLASSLGFVVWKLMSYSNPPSTPTEGGGKLPLGLPGIASAESTSRVHSRNALVYDVDAQKIMNEHNAFERRPIASITKLMTAMVALDYGMKWDEEITIQPEEYTVGGKLILAPGESITAKDAFAASLIASANNATLALVRNLNVPKEEFIRQMNRKAIELGLEQTEFFDVTGLDSRNVSTAYEVALLAHTAFTKYPEIADITAAKEYTFTVRGTNREHTMKNANKLIEEWGISVSGGKTGYIYESKYCLVVQGEGEHENRIAVVLGAPSEVEQYADIKQLLAMPAP